MILTLTITYKLEIQHIDIYNAFLNGDLHEEVYIQQPYGFIDYNPYLVCKLGKAIYGLKQAPRAWYEKLHQTLDHLGFTSSRCDHFLFVYNHQNI